MESIISWGVTHTTFMLFQACIHFMKMHSYTSTNSLFKQETNECAKRGWKPTSNYPHNVI